MCRWWRWTWRLFTWNKDWRLFRPARVSVKKRSYMCDACTCTRNVWKPAVLLAREIENSGSDRLFQQAVQPCSVQNKNMRLHVCVDPPLTELPWTLSVQALGSMCRRLLSTPCGVLTDALIGGRKLEGCVMSGWRGGVWLAESRLMRFDWWLKQIKVCGAQVGASCCCVDVWYYEISFHPTGCLVLQQR